MQVPHIDWYIIKKYKKQKRQIAFSYCIHLNQFKSSNTLYSFSLCITETCFPMYIAGKCFELPPLFIYIFFGVLPV